MSGQDVSHAGVRIAVRNGDGHVLAVRFKDGDGFNLIGGPGRGGESSLETAKRHLLEQAGLRTAALRHAYQGLGDKYYHCVAFYAEVAGDPRHDIVDGAELAYVEIGDVLRGRWGLFARDVFNGAGWMARPRLIPAILHKISKKAIENGSNRATEAVDLVIDEFTLLQDIGKTFAIDSLLEEVDVRLLHPDVADAMLVVAEGIGGLRGLESFRIRVERRLEEIDGPRKKFALKGPDGKIISEDVRADARKYYRKKAREFGEMLRNGTLTQGFPGRHRGGAPIRKDLPPEWEKAPEKDSN